MDNISTTQYKRYVRVLFQTGRAPFEITDTRRCEIYLNWILYEEYFLYTTQALRPCLILNWVRLL